MTGTYNEVDDENNINIVANIEEGIQIKLTSHQELCIYTQEGVENAQFSSLDFSPKYFIESVQDFSSGIFIVTIDNKVNYFQ